jgi:uroporphyrin-III C-methyltransferase / precorrin-2 dehydrogenase / sirohydrochlorin ferrochelatase
MQRSDVCIYDKLVSKDVLNLVRRDAEFIYVGKERDRHTLPQEKINQLLVKLAKKGMRVLRLKGGDPFIFGRGGEEIEMLMEHKIPFQVVAWNYCCKWRILLCRHSLNSSRLCTVLYICYRSYER